MSKTISASIVCHQNPARIEEMLNCFLSGKNANTIEAYRNDLEGFRAFLGVPEIGAAVSRMVSLSSGEANGLVLQYRNSLVASGLQSSTINRRLAALRSLVKLARMLGLIVWTIEIPNLKVETYRDTRGPGRGAVQEMLRLLEIDGSKKQVRDYALLRLLYDLALRASEVVQIDVSHVDLSAGTIEILGKGKTQRSPFNLPPETCKAVSAWMAVRDPDETPLFYNFDRTGRRIRLTRSGLYQLIRKLGAKVGVKTRPHGIRHTSISQAIKVAQLNGITLPEVRQFSRHASLQTLQIYADRERNLFGRIACLVSQSAPGADNLENGIGRMDEKIKKAK